MTDEQIEAMSDGDFYHFMLSQDHYVWAKWMNRMGKLGLNSDQEEILAVWVANAQMAMIDRQNAGYIRARLDAEQAESTSAN